MKAKAKQDKPTEISILEVSEGRVAFLVVGSSPLIYNAMSEKARQQLLMPAPPKNAADKRTTLKHEPFNEYRAGVYRMRDPKAPTVLGFPTVAFKKALASTALDLPGAAKSEISRLVWCIGDMVPVYGVPKVLCSVVRSSDMARTPDVRTRAILSEWCCRVDFAFLRPNLTDKAISTLLAASGMIRGVGDWRQEKGSGSYGRFRLVAEDDADYARIVASGGREAQLAALEEPDYYDEETRNLLCWFVEQKEKRGSMQPPANGKRAKAAAEPEVEA